MPEGRMLKKAISTSKKLAQLKTDTARLLYTWLIPFLDIEGKILADPLVLKGMIFPRIASITPEVISECLYDMQDAKLVKLYKWNGDQYLQFCKFKEHQTLRSDRERPSDIPNPGDDTEPITRTPGVVLEQIRSTPAQDKIIEVKIREDNKAALLHNLKDKIKKISEMIYHSGKWDKVNAFVNHFKSYNQDALLHTLEQFYKHSNNGRTIEHPWAYCLEIMKIENGNFNEREAIAVHNAIKDASKDFKLSDIT